MSWKNYNPKKHIKHYENLSDWGVEIPTTDEIAYTIPRNAPYKWVYDKLKICESQNLPCGPIGTQPTQYPVIVKPVYNLWGGGTSVHIAHNQQQYDKIKIGGLFWSPFHIGEHYSIDLIVLNGQVQETIWFRGEKLSLGMFDYWELTKQYSDKLWCYVTDWVHYNLSGYTGCVNIEIIGEYITEVHLRMGDIDRLNSLALMESIHVLYNSNTWPSIDLKLPDTFYLAALFGQPNTVFTVNTKQLDVICKDLYYHQVDTASNYHSNPPSGNRLAIFCDPSLDKVCNARNIAISLIMPHIDGRYVSALRGFDELRL
jgi:hypothetical protein